MPAPRDATRASLRTRIIRAGSPAGTCRLRGRPASFLQYTWRRRKYTWKACRPSAPCTRALARGSTRTYRILPQNHAAPMRVRTPSHTSAHSLPSAEALPLR